MKEHASHVETKKCRKCGAYKPATEFGINRRNKDGLDILCKECRREYRRMDYDRHGSLTWKITKLARKIWSFLNQPLWGKKCTRCKKVKSLEEFYVRNRKESGEILYHNICKECSRRLGREYYQKNRERILRKAKEEYRNHREHYLKRSKETFYKSKLKKLNETTNEKDNNSKEKDNKNDNPPEHTPEISIIK